MAFDGIAVSCLRKELADRLTGGRITKIVQSESDELLLTIKNNGAQYRLLLSASASLPLIYLTETNKPAPMTAPGFCMLLRKHLGGGRITTVTQPSLERILHFEIEHLDEMGDLCRKTLIAELMGKHSNLIFCKEDGTILDSIKHVSLAVSSVREVLPGRSYFIPHTQDKLDPLTTEPEAMVTAICRKPVTLGKAIYTTLTGFSPVMAEELCYRSSLDAGRPAAALGDTEQTMLAHQLLRLMESIREGSFAPTIYYKGKEPIEFSALPLTLYEDLEQTRSDSMSGILEQYYATKNTLTRIHQKSADLRRIVQTALERSRKKYDLQSRQLADTKKREKYKIWGELIHTYGYDVPEGARSMEALNYYTNETITIPLDPTLSAQENAKKYFDKYGKLKRTFEAVTGLLQETGDEVTHLESVQTALDMALTEEDLVQIKEELIEAGYIRRKGGGKKVRITSKPYHYRSSDGFDIYVGKNNLQNEELTFQFASGNDWWFHAKGVPGSHVIVKTEGKELPDRTFEEAGRLAAWYSKNRGGDKVEIDYVQKKHVKKPGGSKPGFVVYYTNYSLVIDSDISGLDVL
ncbi:NFACT family protein [Anaerosacchariphilus sp. NSJ-68]|uniref:Rqc2 homolog RqcH n=2 Tax=Lachnospiraceae TaxID=186803 RepID=A0A923LBC3_9FIRM|nr:MULTISPECIES: NFACT RNA binding domain-containing protein [Lachnospiraceae]MBC5659403.1 NFACT family protein [Anaerosacchariphilus hominis]MBC5697069.1 NFACT family protein [Roseburia difficilis]